MELFQVWIAPIALGAIIGYFTNYLAIKMLFRPKRAWYLGKHRVPFTPGIIPKNKDRLARAVGQAVGEKLLTRSDILRNNCCTERYAAHLWIRLSTSCRAHRCPYMHWRKMQLVKHPTKR